MLELEELVRELKGNVEVDLDYMISDGIVNSLIKGFSDLFKEKVTIRKTIMYPGRIKVDKPDEFIIVNQNYPNHKERWYFIQPNGIIIEYEVSREDVHKGFQIWQTGRLFDLGVSGSGTGRTYEIDKK